MADKASNAIAFQGLPGAYSELASRLAHPWMSTLPTAAFEDTFGAVRDGKARLAMIPIGFSFNYFGTDYTSVFVGTNGYLAFAATGGGSATGCMLDPAVPNEIIAPLWARTFSWNPGPAPGNVWVLSRPTSSSPSWRRACRVRLTWTLVRPRASAMCC